MPESVRQDVVQQLVSAGDINGDGLMEFGIAGSSNFMIYGAEPDAPRSYQLVKRFPAPNSVRPESVSIRDFHGDGTAEFFAVNKSSKLFVYDRGAVYVSKPPLEFDIAGSGDDTITVADFDADGNQDILLFFANPVIGSPDNLAVYFGTGELSAKFASPDGDFTFLKTNPDGTFTRTYKDGSFVTFDSAGRQSVVTDANGNRTQYAYDAAGRLVSVTDPAGLVTANVYNAQGLLTKVTDPDGRMTIYAYETDGRLASVTYPDGSVMRYGSDGKGYITSETDQRGQTTSHSYDAGGRLTTTAMPNGATVKVDIARSLGLASFGVDLAAPKTAKFVAPADRVVKLADAKGNAAEQEVNEWGAVICTSDPIGRTTLFARDADNLVTRVTAPSSVTPTGTLVTTLDYDGLGNVTSKTEAAGTPLARTSSWEYEPVRSRALSMTDPAGNKTVWQYDASGNTTREILPDGNSLYWTYDGRGLKLSQQIERGFSGIYTTYTHDAYGRVETVRDPRSVTTKFTLDARGNVAQSTDAFGTALARTASNTYDPLNRVLSTTNARSETSSFAYDAEGNMLSTTDASGIAARRSYDANGRLASLIDPSSGTSIPAYDLNDNITRVTASDGSQTSIAYDGVNRVTQTTDALGIVRRVAYDARDNIIAITDGRGSTTTFAYDVLDR